MSLLSISNWYTYGKLLIALMNAVLHKFPSGNCHIEFNFLLFYYWFSMEVLPMLLHLPRTPTFTSTLMQIVLKKLWTGMDLTPYYLWKSIYEMPYGVSLFRFAQFFVKPLMSPDATTREIKAVDSGEASWFVNIDVFSPINIINCWLLYCLCLVPVATCGVIFREPKQPIIWWSQSVPGTYMDS